MRTIDWVDGVPRIVDQTLLPDELRLIDLTTVEELIDAILRLAVRGAPALGVAGAMGVALAVRLGGDVDDAVRRIRSARPTAVNLAWGVDRAASRRSEGADAVLVEALAVRDEEIAASREMGRRGADLLTELVEGRPRILTHCNAGGLATGGYGTAVGALRRAWEEQLVVHVWVDETRPLLQGSRLTAWELEGAGVPHTVIADSAAASLMARGEVDCVVTGADCIAANGDTANKIGTYSLAVLAHHHGIPLYVVAPTSTIDSRTPSGAGIPIEERAGTELTGRFKAYNPAFDVTPAELVSAIVTERGVHRPPYAPALAQALQAVTISVPI